MIDGIFPPVLALAVLPALLHAQTSGDGGALSGSVEGQDERS